MHLNRGPILDPVLALVHYDIPISSAMSIPWCLALASMKGLNRNEYCNLSEHWENLTHQINKYALHCCSLHSLLPKITILAATLDSKNA